MPISSMHSTKYDGRLHYRYPVSLIDQSSDRLITYSQPGDPIESYRGSWTAKNHLLSIFWRNQPYVLHIRWTDQWQPEFLYVDISDATQWDDQTVRYIDLDLDLILHHNSSAIHLDDEDEFEAHRKEWNYPDQLVKNCWTAVDTVRALLTIGNSPFNPSMFSWRPPLANIFKFLMNRTCRLWIGAPHSRQYTCCMSHEIQDKASLEMATRIAAGLPDHPEWLELAKSNLDRWSHLNHDSPRLIACYREWQQILERPIEKISAVLTAQTDEGQRLRQNSPFAGALAPAEVWEIKGWAHATTRV